MLSRLRDCETNCRFVSLLQVDLRLWLPGKESSDTKKDEKSDKSDKEKGDKEDLDLEMAHRLLRQVGDQFCDLLHQEKDALQQHMAEGKFPLLLDPDVYTFTIFPRIRNKISNSMFIYSLACFVMSMLNR